MDPLAQPNARHSAAAPTSETTVEALFADWPETVPRFVALRLACPGCDMARYCSLADVAANYHIATAELVAAAQSAIEGRWRPDNPEMGEDEWNLE